MGSLPVAGSLVGLQAGGARGVKGKGGLGEGKAVCGSRRRVTHKLSKSKALSATFNKQSDWKPTSGRKPGWPAGRGGRGGCLTHLLLQCTTSPKWLGSVEEQKVSSAESSWWLNMSMSPRVLRACSSCKQQQGTWSASQPHSMMKVASITESATIEGHKASVMPMLGISMCSNGYAEL